MSWSSELEPSTKAWRPFSKLFPGTWPTGFVSNFGDWPNSTMKRGTDEKLGQFSGNTLGYPLYNPHVHPFSTRFHRFFNLWQPQPHIFLHDESTLQLPMLWTKPLGSEGIQEGQQKQRRYPIRAAGDRASEPADAGPVWSLLMSFMGPNEKFSWPCVSSCFTRLVKVYIDVNNLYIMIYLSLCIITCIYIYYAFMYPLI